MARIQLAYRKHLHLSSESHSLKKGTSHLRSAGSPVQPHPALGLQPALRACCWRSPPARAQRRPLSLPALLQLHLSQPESEGIVEERQSVAGFNSELASEAVFLGHTLAGSEELPSQPVVCKVRVCERKRSWRRLTEHLLGLLWGALAGAPSVFSGCPSWHCCSWQARPLPPAVLGGEPTPEQLPH